MAAGLSGCAYLESAAKASASAARAACVRAHNSTPAHAGWLLRARPIEGLNLYVWLGATYISESDQLIALGIYALGIGLVYSEMNLYIYIYESTYI
jgi:hypothetical protein